MHRANPDYVHRYTWCSIGIAGRGARPSGIDFPGRQGWGRQRLFDITKVARTHRGGQHTLMPTSRGKDVLDETDAIFNLAGLHTAPHTPRYLLYIRTRPTNTRCVELCYDNIRSSEFYGLGVKAQGSGFGVQGSGFRV